ncbi:MAG: hydroxymethylbilane synthase [Rhodothermales bacterium]|nr:hydroxymethylbilane synthase [Rhodothermales bacterium]
MQFVAFGINHQTAPLELRERFALSEDSLRTLYRTTHRSPASELVIVSTCNRTECYLFGTAVDGVHIKHALGTAAGHPWPEAVAFEKHDEAAVRHVLEVTAGMQSMVIGDGQILGQIKDAYRLAVDESCVGAVVHRLMHSAFRGAKRIVTETDIAGGHASVPGMAALIASDFVREQGFEEVDMLIVGAGHMGWLAAQVLRAELPGRLRVTNRTPLRALELAAHVGIEVVSWEDIHAAAAGADVVVVTTGAPAPVLLAELLPADATRPRLVLDLASPRNVDPAVGALSGYTLVDLDALMVRIAGVQAGRRRELPAAHRITDEMLADFVAWFFHHLALQPAIKTILETFDTIRRQEIDRHAHRLTALELGELERLTWSIMQKVLAVPVVRLKTVGLSQIDYANGIRLLQMLFSREGCDEVETPQGIPPAHAVLESTAITGACPFDERPASEHALLRVEARRGRVLRLGTRASALALWQANRVKTLLEAAGHTVLIEEITTQGDQVQDVPLWQVEGKSFFTRELDHALLVGRIDLAVHSLKDLPTALPTGLVLAAVSEREQPLDAFVAHPSFVGRVDDLPAGARIATSSLRRTALLKAWRPDLEIVSVRGNVDTRLKKLAASDWHGMVLAAAGLIRLGVGNQIRTLLDPSWMLPAVGQGALGIVCADRDGLPALLKAALNDPETETAVRAERAFLRRLEGGCQVPVGAWARHDLAEGLVLDGCVAALDGQVVFRDRIAVDDRRPEEAGILLAERLIAEGAGVVLQSIRS